MQEERKLKVYQEAISLCKDIYLIRYPVSELYGLQSQIRRATMSISLLIAEGCGRATDKDFKHYLIQARGSCKEVQTALELSKELSFIDIQTYTSLYNKAGHVGAMLTNLLNKVGGENSEKRQTKDDKPQTV
jgi:four helix bundle protein